MFSVATLGASVATLVATQFLYTCDFSLRSVLWQVTLIADTALHLKHFVGLVHEL